MDVEWLITPGEGFEEVERKTIQEYYAGSSSGGKLPIWLALLISPVVLLVPRKLTGKRIWGMGELLKVSTS